MKYLENSSEELESVSSDSSVNEVSNSTIDNELLYQGRRYDSETNLYYYRARYYDPIMGRFLSTDPMGYKDSMNLYQAFNMNGMNFVDPLGKYFVITGRKKKKIAKVLAKGAVTPKGSAIFWKIYNDPRPVYICDSNQLDSSLRGQNINLHKPPSSLTFKQTYGVVDPGKTMNDFSAKGKVTKVYVEISYENLNKYSILSRKLDVSSEGKLDSGGITTLYHELYHVNDFLNLDINKLDGDSPSPYLNALNMVREGDLVEGKYSVESPAQRLGEKVFQETELKYTKDQKKIMKEIIEALLNNPKKFMR